MEPTHASADGVEHQVEATVPIKCKTPTTLVTYETKFNHENELCYLEKINRLAN